MEELTKEQIDQIIYFWLVKGDIERYCEFERLKPQIEKQFPDLLKSLENYKSAIETLNNEVKSLYPFGEWYKNY